MKKRFLEIGFIFGMSLMLSVFVYAQRDPAKEILIKFKLEVSRSNIDQLMKEKKLELVREYPGIQNLFLCRVLGENVEKVMGALQKDKQIEYIEHNQEVQAL